MPIYKYTMKKYMMSWSTWIIIGVSFLFTFLLGGWLPFQFLNPDSPTAMNTYMGIYVGIISAVTSFLAIFTSIFAGFKSAQMFKDEVEDGTFLLLLSKPIPRGKIIFYKWLALQTVMLIFTFATAITFMFAMIIFDKGDSIDGLKALNVSTLRSSSWLIALVMWGILTIFGLIFSSVALLLSTKLSTGSTIGISIAIGVVIPMTGMVAMFTKHSEVKHMNESGLESAKAEISTLTAQIHDEENNKFLNDAYDQIILELRVASNNQHDAIINQLDQMTPNDIWEIIQGIFVNYYNFAKSDTGMYNIGVTTDVNDVYDGAWIADLNFQVQQISSIGGDAVIPAEAQAVAEDNLAGTIYSSTRYVSTGTLNDIAGSLATTDDQSTPSIDESSIIDQLFLKNNEEISSLRSAINYLFLLTNHFMVSGYDLQDGTHIGGFNPMNMAKLVAQDSDFKFTLNKAPFDKDFGIEVLNYIYPENISKNLAGNNAEIEAAANAAGWIVNKSGNAISSFTLSFDDFQTLIDKLTITELNLLKSQGSNPILYGNLVANMYDNYTRYNAAGTPEEKQLYLIPELSKMLFTKYTSEFEDTIYKLNIQNDKYITFYYLMLMYAERSTTPVSSLLIDESKLSDLVHEKNIPLSTQTGYNPDQGDQLVFNPLNLYGNELDIYNTLKSIEKFEHDNNKNILVKIERKPYVNKYGLLGFYAGIALLLVPLSYALIRKQDYR